VDKEYITRNPVGKIAKKKQSKGKQYVVLLILHSVPYCQK